MFRVRLQFKFTLKNSDLSSTKNFSNCKPQENSPHQFSSFQNFAIPFRHQKHGAFLYGVGCSIRERFSSHLCGKAPEIGYGKAFPPHSDRSCGGTHSLFATIQYRNRDDAGDDHKKKASQVIPHIHNTYEPIFLSENPTPYFLFLFFLWFFIILTYSLNVSRKRRHLWY